MQRQQLISAREGEGEGGGFNRRSGERGVCVREGGKKGEGVEK